MTASQDQIIQLINYLVLERENNELEQGESSSQQQPFPHPYLRFLTLEDEGPPTSSPNQNGIRPDMITDLLKRRAVIHLTVDASLVLFESAKRRGKVLRRFGQRLNIKQGLSVCDSIDELGPIIY
ncbi:hypothetical protein DL93DRAFT_2086513 [Clavulina sp. PMI_390]|nr:hypothetical protein DL93DRAFT_2086513 [Clavulina sp. PMI_390]